MDSLFPGLCAGITQTLIGHPFDTIKTRMQSRQQKLHFRNLYAGCGYPFLVSMVSNGALFPCYEYCTKTLGYSIFFAGAVAGAVISPIVFLSDCYKISKQTSTPLQFRQGFLTTLARESLAFSIYFQTFDLLTSSDIHPALAGGCAGLTNWAATYPLDTIRTRQVTGCTAIEAIRIGKLYCGISVCLLRAVLVNAGIFYTYTEVSKHMK